MAIDPKTVDVINKMLSTRKLDDNGRLNAPGVARDELTGFVSTKKIPEPASLFVDSSPGRLRSVLEEFKLVDHPDVLRADAMRYVGRLTQLEGEALLAEVERVVGENNLLKRARRMSQRYMLAMAVGGDADKDPLMIRIDEGDDNTCDACDALGGMIAPLSEHAAHGLPGSASCLGGDYCRCTLMRVDDDED
jgi:hypothetical protein